MPFATLEELNTPEAAKAFFNDNFPSAVKIIGEERLLEDFEKNPRGNLVTINARRALCRRCKLIIVGDAVQLVIPCALAW